MLQSKYPKYVDEKYRIELIEHAEKEVYWISSTFSEKEQSAINSIMMKVPSFIFKVIKCEVSIIEKIECCISIQSSEKSISLLSSPEDFKGKSAGVLAVDDIICIYSDDFIENDSKDKSNARFFNNFNGLRLLEQIKEIENDSNIKINIFNSNEQLELIDRNKSNYNISSSDFDGKGKNNISNINVIEEVELRYIQDRVKFVDIKGGGTKSDLKRISIDFIKNLIGKMDNDVDSRLAIDWKVFGDDKAIKDIYKSLWREFSAIKDKYLYDIKSYGRVLIIKNQDNFLNEIDCFEERFKNVQDSILYKYLSQSKNTLKNAIKSIYDYASSDKFRLKTCSRMELDSIIAQVDKSFPALEDISEKLQIDIRYTEISKKDLEHKDFCLDLARYSRNIDFDLSEVLNRLANR